MYIKEQKKAFDQLTKTVNKQIDTADFDDEVEYVVFKSFLLSSLLIVSPSIYKSYTKEQQEKSEALIKEYAFVKFNGNDTKEFLQTLRQRVIEADFMPLLFNKVFISLLDTDLKEM